MATRYGWRPGAQIAIDAQKAGKELERISRAHNRPVTADDVLDAAADPANVLHPAFTWDDAAAAKKQRLAEAGHLIRSITIDVSKSNLSKSEVRAFVNVQQGEQRGYMTMVSAMSDRDLRKQLVEKAYAELEAWRSRYAELSELARIFEAIDQARSAA